MIGKRIKNSRQEPRIRKILGRQKLSLMKSKESKLLRIKTHAEEAKIKDKK